MKVSRFVFNMFGENTYVLWDPASRQAAVVDPGMIDAQERSAIDGFLEREHLTVKYLINTHSHLDHVFGNAHIASRYGASLSGHPADDNLMGALSSQAAMFGIRKPVESVERTVDLHDGDTLTLGDEEIRVLEVPGHSPGSIALYCPASGFVVTGDALFPGSVGRTDLPGGDHATLIGSIREKLLTLPDDTVVLSGHGGETTIGRERAANPFLR